MSNRDYNYQILFEQLDLSLYPTSIKNKVYYVRSLYKKYLDLKIKTNGFFDDYGGKQDEDEVEYIKEFEKIANIVIPGPDFPDVPPLDIPKYFDIFISCLLNSTPKERAVLLTNFFYNSCIKQHSFSEKTQVINSNKEKLKIVLKYISDITSPSTVSLEENTISFEKGMELLEKTKDMDTSLKFYNILLEKIVEIKHIDVTNLHEKVSNISFVSDLEDSMILNARKIGEFLETRPLNTQQKQALEKKKLDQSNRDEKRNNQTTKITLKSYLPNNYGEYSQKQQQVYDADPDEYMRLEAEERNSQVQNGDDDKDEYDYK
jgi:hypothetical protein